MPAIQKLVILIVICSLVPGYLNTFRIYRFLKLSFLNVSEVSRSCSFNISFSVSSAILAINRNRSWTIIPFYPSRKLNLESSVWYTVTIWLGILDLVPCSLKHYENYCLQTFPFIFLILKYHFLLCGGIILIFKHWPGYFRGNLYAHWLW